MGGVDKCLTLKEERAMKWNAAASSYALKVQSTSNDVFYGDASTDSHSSSCSVVASDSEAGPSTQKIQRLTSRMRGSVEVVNPEVAAALDRTNTSDRKAAHILSALASTGQLQHDVEELIISPSAIRRA